MAKKNKALEAIQGLPPDPRASLEKLLTAEEQSEISEALADWRKLPSHQKPSRHDIAISLSLAYPVGRGCDSWLRYLKGLGV